MSFVFIGALAIALFVVAPIAAHLLKVRRAQQRPFPPASLVPASPPASRQRRKLEDHSLFILRVLAILALALLGATPLIQCSRLAVFRSSGASLALAIVIDDSMSMRARDDGKASRFQQAQREALDLLAGPQKGDAFAVVLAGEPVRVALAPTTDVSVVRKAIEGLQPSDRATNLDGALVMASSLISEMPQPQRQVVVLSDLCDGQPEAKPLGEGLEMAVWIPPRSLTEDPHDCAVLHAEVRDGRVVSRVACTHVRIEPERFVVVRSDTEEIGRVGLTSRMPATGGAISMEIPTQGRSSEASEVLLVGGEDLISENDRAPVAHHLETLTIGVLSDRTLSGVETGGAPPVEQALAALQTGAMIQPIPTVPDTTEELGKYTVLILDDPPGLTPEARDAVRVWLSQGGVALVGLGPRAARSPLGSTLEPFVQGIPRWLEGAPSGMHDSDLAALGPSGASLERLSARGRTQLDLGLFDEVRVVMRWSDEVPALMEVPMGRGLVFLVGLPFGPSWSDLPLRPAFLTLLSRIAETGRVRGGNKRIEVGQTWSFENGSLEVRNSQGEYPVIRSHGKARVVPHEAGRYDIRIDGEVETRFAVIPEREVDLRPRRAAETTQGESLGGTEGSVDISRWIALFLLALLAGELAIRAWMSRPALLPRSR